MVKYFLAVVSALLVINCSTASAFKLKFHWPHLVERPSGLGIGDLFTRLFCGPLEADIARIMADVNEDMNSSEPQIAAIFTEHQVKALLHQVSPPPVTGFSAFPSDDSSWSAVFDGSHPSDRQKDLASSLNNDFNQNMVDRRPRRLPTNIDEFVELLHATDSDVFTIVGHNDGVNLTVPPHHLLELEEMDTACRSVAKICVFLSCKATSSVQIGASRKLDLPDAMDLARHTRRITEIAIEEKRDKRALAEPIIMVIQRTESSQKRRYALYHLVRLEPRDCCS
jgi:hypothetical protein